jgi:hypothetical protein
VPTFAEVGVPESSPVALLKVAHEGLWTMVNTRRRCHRSLAVGVKEYDFPTVTVVAGEPEIFTGFGHGFTEGTDSFVWATPLTLHVMPSASATRSCHSGKRWPKCR